ncbi:MAG TPA: alpha/beta hydrolase [Coriobacteriia bacterium]|nr:alpha/beta hydrolase [Coriobacteriia bacterium]
MVILLHGGGLSSWATRPVAARLEKNYRTFTPIIDGHGEDYEKTFSSIEDCAAELIDYIDKEHQGKVFALCGLSLGAQIAVEVLAQRSAIADYAIIESALVTPIKMMSALATLTYGLGYGLIKKRWFSQMQAKELLIPDDMFKDYYRDTAKMSKQSLINISKSNAGYSLPQTLSKTEAKVLVVVGGKERTFMKASATKLHSAIKSSRLYVAQDLKHGELSICKPDQYLDVFEGFITP